MNSLENLLDFSDSAEMKVTLAAALLPWDVCCMWKLLQNNVVCVKLCHCGFGTADGVKTHVSRGKVENKG